MELRPGLNVYMNTYRIIWNVQDESNARDGWNKDFVYVLDPELAEGFGIYSCGQDGVSSSNGNDRDDLNTWRRRHWFGYHDHWISRMDMPSSVIALGTILLIAAAIVPWWKISRSP